MANINPDDSSLTVSVQGSDELARRLGRILRGLSDFSEPMDEVGKTLTGFFSGQVFASRGGVIGELWPALSDEYAAQKAIDFPGRPPLIRTGDMNRGFESDPSRKSVLIFNSTEYFDDHQLGRGVPKRVMMKIDDARQNLVVEVLESYIDRKVQQS